MKKKYLSVIFVFFWFSLSAQHNQDKVFSISLGYGYFNEVKNANAGGNVWVGANYKFRKSLFFIMEFENASFEVPENFGTNGVFDSQYFIDNSFTLGVQYRLPLKSKIQIAFGSGISYRLRTKEYFDSLTSINGNSYSSKIEITDALGIPTIVELRYPITKYLFVGARIKTNFYMRQRSTYGGGLLLAIKL